MKLTTPLEHIKGVGPKTAQALSAAGLETVADALDFLPRAYDDYSAAVNIVDLQPGKVTVRARCESISTRIVRRGLRITTAVLADDSGKVKAVWFNQPYRESQLRSDAEFMFSGQFGMQYNSYQISNPSVELAKQTNSSDAQPTSGIHPVYKTIKNLRPKTVQDLLKNLRPIMEFLPETLPEHIVQRQKLVSRAEAVRFLHAPNSHEEIARGRERLAFEELFEMILAAQLNKQEQTKLTGWRIPFNQPDQRAAPCRVADFARFGVGASDESSVARRCRLGQNGGRWVGSGGGGTGWFPDSHHGADGDFGGSARQNAG